jgi:galactokinase
VIGEEELVDRLAALEPSVEPSSTEVVRAPGRVNLIGEYTDINDGFVLPAAIDLEIRIAFARTTDRRVVLHRLDTDETASFDLDDLPARSGAWIDYAVGTAWSLGQADLPITGIRGVIASTLPVGSGLSSSAAIEMAVAHALLGAASADVEPVRLAQLGQRAENEFIGVKSGLMDQFASNCGRAGSALLLDCRTLDWRPVPVPEDLDLVVCDTGSAHRLATSDYNERRAQCEAAVAILRQDDPSISALRDVDRPTLAAAIEGGRLTGLPARRARHIVSENERVLASVAALDAGELDAVTDAFAASHASLRDDFAVSSAELDALVDIAIATPGVVAARMTGAGFGGCTINLVRPDAVEGLKAAIEAEYPRRTGLRPTVYPVRAVDGAGLVGG